jgi:F0F1-type ATP synthase assembly protein I
MTVVFYELVEVKRTLNSHDSSVLELKVQLFEELKILLNLEVLMKEQAENKSKTNAALRYTSIGSQLLVFLAAGVFGGLKLDALWHTKPLMLITLSTLALVFSLVHLYRQLVKKK